MHRESTVAIVMNLDRNILKCLAWLNALKVQCVDFGSI